MWLTIYAKRAQQEQLGELQEVPEAPDLEVSDEKEGCGRASERMKKRKRPVSTPVVVPRNH